MPAWRIAILLALPLEIIAFKGLDFLFAKSTAFYIHFPAFFVASGGSPQVFIAGYVELVILTFLAITLCRTLPEFRGK